MKRADRISFETRRSMVIPQPIPKLLVPPFLIDHLTTTAELSSLNHTQINIVISDVFAELM